MVNSALLRGVRQLYLLFGVERRTMPVAILLISGKSCQTENTNVILQIRHAYPIATGSPNAVRNPTHNRCKFLHASLVGTSAVCGSSCSSTQ